MEYKDYVKVGNKVRRTWREYDYYSATQKGYGATPYETKTEIVTIKSSPRDVETSKFVSLKGCVFGDEIEVKVENKKGNVYYVTIENLTPYKEIQDLTFEDLKTLRSEIHPGSLYLSDFRNSFGIDEKTVSDYADGYVESLYEEYGENWEDYDTPESFAEYCMA